MGRSTRACSKMYPPNEKTTMNKGTVNGFIQPAGGGKDVFVHVSAVERSGIRGLSEGQKVIFELQTDRRTGRSSAVNSKAA